MNKILSRLLLIAILLLSSIPIAAHPAAAAGTKAQVWVETASDGTGQRVPAQNLEIGSRLIVFCIARDNAGNFVANSAADSWSLVRMTGGVKNTDLEVAADRKSAILTGKSNGSAIIHVELGSLANYDSRPITITGSGEYVPQLSLATAGLTTTAPIIMGTDGISKAAAQYQTVDGKVTLDIADGTRLADAKGNILTSLSVVSVSAPQKIYNGDSVLTAYNFFPEKAAFSPALTVTFSYGTLPEGAENIRLAFWDGSSWQSEPAAIDSANNTVTAQISCLREYALIIQDPTRASLAFNGLSISPQNVNPGEPVTIETEIVNSGDLSGSCNLTLRINNQQVATKDVIVAGGRTETSTFQVQREAAGQYTVDVNGRSGQFTVISSSTTAPETPPLATVAGIAASPGSGPEKTKSLPTAVTRSPDTDQKSTTSSSTWVIGIIGVVIVLAGVIALILRRRRI